MEKKISRRDKVRSALTEMTDQGQIINLQNLAEKLDLVTAEELSALKIDFKDLRKRGELLKHDDGSFYYQAKATVEKKSAQIYRAVRASKEFTLVSISQMAECSAHYTQQVFQKLQEAGYINCLGQKGPQLEKIYMASQKCRASPEPPNLIYKTVPLALEKQAAVKIVEIVMLSDLSKDNIINQLRKNIEILSNRFGGKGVNND